MSSIKRPLGAVTSQSGSVEISERAPLRVGVRSGTLGLLALVGLLGCAIVVCISAAGTNVLLPESLRPISGAPWMAGIFGDSGPHLGAGVLLPVLTLMFAAYVVAVRTSEHMSPRVVLAAIGALDLIVLLAPPLFSTDVFSYQAYARMWVTYSANPYLAGPHVMVYDPLYPFIGANWISTPTAYGPLFTLLSALLDKATLGMGINGSIAASTLAYKATAAAACLAVVTLVWRAARLRGLNPVRAAALVGLNPLVVLYGVGGGHNDLLMLALTTCGVWALLAHRDRTSGSMIMLGTAVKLTGLLVLPFALASGPALGAGRRRKALAIGAAATALAVAVVGFAVFGFGQLHLVGTLQQIQSKGNDSSLSGFLLSIRGLGRLGQVVGLVLAAAFASVCGWLLLRVWQGRMDWIDGAGWATAAMLGTASAILPWYVAWLMPLAALSSDRRLWRVSLWITGLLQLITMIPYIPHPFLVS